MISDGAPINLKLTRTAVNAIIVRDDGRILMQQRDDFPGLPFPGCWTFFGGLVEKGEAHSRALQRELIEELGRMPGRLEGKLFTWASRSDWVDIQNHFFLVRSEVPTEELALAEGQAMSWFGIEDLARIPLTPAVYENYLPLAKHVSQFRESVDGAIESSLLEVNELRRKNDRVFYARRNPCVLSRQQIFLLKALACLREVPVFRVCLHVDDASDIHEMLMVHTTPTRVGPLKQDKTSLSYHALEGSLVIKLYDDSGTQVSNYRLGTSEPAAMPGLSLRLRASQYRSIESVSPFAMFIEVASGPFQDSDTVWFTRR